ncbi:MAG TPA: polymer-forming cytoskeletal protein [Nannocystaceae bacterium]|nr:polymer-forming cytoskeletal protein [Nannocystaceae bacterium]
MARATTTTPPAQPIDGATVVGPGIRISGRVTGEEDLHVEGRIDGAIQLSDTLYVAHGGIVAAEVEAHNVVVSGVVVGNVTARDCVTLHAGAKLVGDITAPRLVIADGAAFKGNVRMGGEPMPARDKSRTAVRPRPVATGLRGVAAANRAPARTDRNERTDRRVPPRPVARVKVDPTEERGDDDDTVIVRHAAIPDEGKSTVRSGRPPAANASAKAGRDDKTEAGAAAAPADKPKPPARATQKVVAAAKKLPPRARIPKPGKRRVGRR